jgi:sulfonate transport system substrate-binding protein
VASAAVRRTYATRVAVAGDEPLIASEQAIADPFTRLKLIPREVDFGAFTDRRFNGDRPSSTTAPRPSERS